MVSVIDAAVARIIEYLDDPEIAADLDKSDAWRAWVSRQQSDAPEPRKQLPIRPDAIVSPDRPPLKMPPRADRFDCLAFGASCRHTLMVDGTGIATPLPCGECEPDREWRVFLKMVRYRHRVSQTHGVVMAIGFPDVDAAARWRSRQGKRAPGARVALLIRNKDYRWECLTLYADRLTDHELALTRRAWKRAKLSGVVVNGGSDADRFQALVPRDACAEGPQGVSRRTCLFTGWPNYEEEPSDYAQDDGVVETGILNPQREPTPLPGWAKALELLPFEERSARFADGWCDVDTLDDYIGPIALINNTRTYMINSIPWREAYRPMLRLMGAENKAPPTVCQGCGRPAQLTPKRLCIRCALSERKNLSGPQRYPSPHCMRSY